MIFPVFPHFRFQLTNAADVLTAKSWDDRLRGMRMRID